MFYKAVGHEGENVDKSGVEPIFEIIIDGKIVKLPAFYFWVWKSFQENDGEFENVARKTFVEFTLLDEAVFNETLEILLLEGVIVSIDK